MRTIFVESRTSTFISAPASLVNTRLFPEIDLIVPKTGGDLAVPGLICSGSCEAAAFTATRPLPHAAITATTVTAHKRGSPANLARFRKPYCSGDFIIPSSIWHFFARSHTYIFNRLDVSFPRNRFTCSPTSRKKVVAGVGIFLSSATPGFFERFITVDFGTECFLGMKEWERCYAKSFSGVIGKSRTRLRFKSKLNVFLPRGALASCQPHE